MKCSADAIKLQSLCNRKLCSAGQAFTEGNAAHTEQHSKWSATTLNHVYDNLLKAETHFAIFQCVKDP